jgi:ABC-type amino acid transport substrate-binding protein
MVPNLREMNYYASLATVTRMERCMAQMPQTGLVNVARRGLLRGVGWATIAEITGFIADRTQAAQSVRTLQPGQLHIGTYFVNPPFEFVSDGNRIGFEVDLMNEIAKRLELRPVFVDTRWEVILREMRHGRFDCIVGGITITPDREKTLAWSTPYMTTTLSIIVDSDRTPNATSLADLKDATVGVQAATTDYDIAMVMQRKGRIGHVRVYPFAHIERAMTDLIAGRINAVMKVYPVAAWLAKQTPSLRIIAQVPNDPQPLGIGFNRHNQALLDAVNGTLASMQRDGGYQALIQHWGLA